MRDVRIFSGAGSWYLHELDKASSRASEVDAQVNRALEAWKQENTTYQVIDARMESRLVASAKNDYVAIYSVTIMVIYETGSI